MARVTHVKKAQQRYAQVVVRNEDGTPKQTPVMRRDGTQKVTKHGRPVFMTVKVADKSQPLPNRKCEKCGKEITVGSPYKHVSPKSGPYGGRTRYRCAACPTWQPWELSNALWARIAQITDGFDVSDAESVEDVEQALSDIAEQIRELAEEKREGASNIEEGFGHPTYQSEELEQTADELESWADEIESADIPEYPEVEEQDCDECSGSGETETDCTGCDGIGEVEADEEGADPEQCGVCDGSGTLVQSCDECDGTGSTTPDEPTDEQIEEWQQEVEDAVSIVHESPV